jgi:branched-chain amino acid transport system ATP-binding protein
MPLLSAIDIVVRFGGVRALSDAYVNCEPGQITGLIGPNGAGKTTLFNAITGLRPPNSGKVVFDGIDITNKSPYRRARLGIGRTFQKLEAFNNLSARNNVLVAAESRRSWDRSKFDAQAETDAIMEAVGIGDIADQMVGTLPTGTARLVELARSLATKPKLLLLDEPSSGLNGAETEAMADLLRRLTADGLGVLLVEHDMAFVMSTCEFIHVLEFGQIIATGTASEIQKDKAVQAAYLGAVPEVEGVS